MELPVTIIVPLFVKNEKNENDGPPSFFEQRELLKHYNGLLDRTERQFEILLMDNSPSEEAARLKNICFDLNIPYALLPDSETRPGNNRKTDAVQYALKNLVSTEKIILFDEDVRPAQENIARIAAELDAFTIVKCIIDFISPDIFDRIDLAGIYAFNRLSRHKQNWANIAFRRSSLLEKGFPPSDVLYDELAIERTLRSGNNGRYIDDLPIPLKSGGRTLASYTKQRGRYAYENIAFKFRFCCDVFVLFALALIVLLPALAGTSFWLSVSIAMLFILVICALVWWASFSYEQSLAYTSAAGRVWPLAALWYWAYPFCSGWALYRYWSRKGIRFGEHVIWRPCI